jgi:hypothetical protein
MIALFLRIFSFAFPFDSIPTIIDRMSKMRRQIARNQMEERIFLNICRGKLFEKTGSMSMSNAQLNGGKIVCIMNNIEGRQCVHINLD